MELDPRFRWFKLEAVDAKLKPCTYVFRGITAKELRSAGTKPTRFAAEDYILSCVVFGEHDWDNLPAGVSLKLIQEVYKISGLTEEAETYAIAADWINSETGALEAASVSMISGLTLEHLDNCCPTNYAKYLLMGKYQFENMYGVRVEDAFKVGASDEAVISKDETVLSVDALGRETAKQSRTTFEWQKGQTVEIDPQFQQQEIFFEPDF